jgi:hypothetical protein
MNDLLSDARQNLKCLNRLRRAMMWWKMTQMNLQKELG